ncbi:MAG: dockerin type I repeat-containing protein [Phycisphaerales bacterium]|nr:dockerin type I repeat-containing protein [Phycisphaerales bacterium]
MRNATILTAATVILAIGSASSAVEVEFHQLNWLDENGDVMIEFSRVCDVELHPHTSDPADIAFLEVYGGGWINISVQVPGWPETEWVVQNLYLCYPDDEYMDDSDTSVHFGLPTPEGFPIDGILFDLWITPEPIEWMNTVPGLWVPVDHVDYHTGGIGEGGSGLWSYGYNPGPWIGPDFLTIHPIRTVHPGIAVRQWGPVSEDINGCGAGSCTRSLQYLADSNGFDVDNPGGMYNDLYDAMGTTPQGTSPTNLANGKKQYTSANGLPVNTRAVEGFSGQIQGIMDAVENGADVELQIVWDEGGAHSAMITGVTSHGDGSYTITYVDDPTQGDGHAESQEHSIHVDSDGEFLEGGSIAGFLVEQHGSPGDINGDGTVDQQDLGMMLGSYGYIEGAVGYDINADVNGNGVVDQGDLGTLLSDYCQ